MRQQIFEKLFDTMAGDPRLFLLTADMGINLVERFQQSYPDRFVNVGIAEQNLLGVAAGLCNAGYRPFVYTISNFLIHRCFEQIRNDLVLHAYPVVMLGTSTGYDNAPLGPTHHVIDDWGCLKGLRGIDIYCPSNADYADALLPRLAAAVRPAYVRIPKGDFAEPQGTDDYQLITAEEQRILLIAYGSLVQNALAVQRERSDVSVLAVNRLHPFDSAALMETIQSHQHIITVEDHFPQTGLFADICQLLGQFGVRRSVTPLGPAEYDLTVGKHAGYYHRKHGTDVEGIHAAIAMLENVAGNQIHAVQTQ